MPKLALVLILTVAAGACDWPQFLSDPAHTSSSPDRSISREAVASGAVSLRWSGILDGAPLTPAVVSGGLAYVGATSSSNSNESELYAFDAAGVAGCSGSPRTCSPLWTTSPLPSGVMLPPSIAAGVAYVALSDLPLRAYDAAGVTNCGGAPKRCDPLWTTVPHGQASSTAVAANGLVYQGFYSIDLAVGAGVAAYDGSGTTNCSGVPKTCSPVWIGRIPRVTSFVVPTVANSVVYVTSDTTLYAFAAAGDTNCSTTLPRSCVPLWQADLPNGTAVGTAPVVSNGYVFQAAANGELEAFDAAGTAGCSGTPKICTRRFFAVASGIPAVADGALYALTPNGRLSVFDATGNERCAATSRQCRALRSYNLPPIQCQLPGPCGTRSPAAVVNGVVYIASTFLKSGGFAALTAFDALGQTSCSGAPLRCNELGHWNNAGPSAAVSNGYLYASTFAFAPDDSRLNAYGPR